MINKLIENKKELILVLILLLVSGLAHGYNMDHFPYFENDEGTYMSQAWSVLRQGKLAPYTYWYDHAPAGWIFIALWVFLTGGFFTFGPSIVSGRVFMLIIHLATTLLLYYVAKKLSGNKIPGIIAILIFSLSPLAIYFQRRVLLDNMMTFWIFVTAAFLLKNRLRLFDVIVSAISFGVAILTKENAIFFIPAFIYLIYQKAGKKQLSFALVNWISIVGLFASFYVLYAFLKTELLPAGILSSQPHVSLLSTLAKQAGRGNPAPFWDQGSDFYLNLIEWYRRDHYLILAGSVATLIGGLISLRNKALRFPFLMALLFILFLIRGGLIIDFYLIPLVPVFALLIGMVTDRLAYVFSFKKSILYRGMIAVVIILPSVYQLTRTKEHFVKDETASQVQTIAWIKENVNEGAFIVMDDSIYVDLHEPGFINDKVYTNAEWAWKVEEDPEIKEGKLKNDWRKIEYIALSHEILRQMRLFDNGFLIKAYNNSKLVKDWSQGSSSHINLPLLISTNGDWMSIYKVIDEFDIALNQTWKYYKENFIVSYGQVIDPQTGRTTSEGQSYALLRAVWVNDKAAFDGILAWTKDHMQHREGDLLLSWLWENDKLADPSSATDADLDIALALALAYKRWGDEGYQRQAIALIKDIWKKEVVEVNGRYVLTSSSDAKRDVYYLVNPSYFSPASYRVFASLDRGHNWVKLADDTYFFLDELKSQYDLPPNWVMVNEKSGRISSATSYLGNDADIYGFDAFRIFWRIALDAQWYERGEAHAFLKQYKDFFINEWNKNGNFSAIYSSDGGRKAPYSSLSTNTAPISLLLTENREIADKLYLDVYVRQLHYEEGYWGDKNNYYDQNWAWFATGLYSENLVNY